MAVRSPPPAGWCSRAPAPARFTALDASSGKELWSAPVQTGVVAAPISYSIDGEQYVAIVVGTGSSWAMIGGDSNMKGYVQRNISRLLVYKLGGTAQLRLCRKSCRCPSIRPQPRPPRR